MAVTSLLKPIDTLPKALQRRGDSSLSLSVPPSFGGNEGDCGLYLHATLNLTYATSAGLRFNGQMLVDYDLNRNTINGQFYSPQDPTSLSLTMDVYIDRTSVEVFIDDGLYSYSMERKNLHPQREDGEGIPLEFWGTDINVTDLQFYAVKSIWE